MGSDPGAEIAPEPVYIFQSGGIHERLLTWGWPASMTRIGAAGEPIGHYVIDHFNADWRYYQVIGLTVDPSGANLPQLDFPWRKQGVLNARAPNVLLLNRERASTDLRQRGFHVYERLHVTTYYRQPSDHPDPTAPPYPAGAKTTDANVLTPQAAKLGAELRDLLKE